MAVTNEEVLNKIKEIVPKFGVNPDDVSDSSTLEDLDMDSLDVVEIMQAIEDDLGIRVPDEDLEDLTTIGDAVAAVVKNG
ncbi:MAG: acyl carrier protein [Thermoleophilaceae bacterium]|jgi:acyl carrier protein|nr:acyl carrier protein [Thermoleophilaceae bacterium]